MPTLRTTRKTAVSTATGCCLRACSIPPCTGSTAIFLNAVAATGGPWALPRWPDERPPAPGATPTHNTVRHLNGGMREGRDVGCLRPEELDLSETRPLVR